MAKLLENYCRWHILELDEFKLLIIVIIWIVIHFWFSLGFVCYGCFHWFLCLNLFWSIYFCFTQQSIEGENGFIFYLNERRSFLFCNVFWLVLCFIFGQKLAQECEDFTNFTMIRSNLLGKNHFSSICQFSQMKQIRSSDKPQKYSIGIQQGDGAWIGLARHGTARLGSNNIISLNSNAYENKNRIFVDKLII